MLSGRLLTIYNKIPNCDIVCDIGTDHGYMLIEIICNNKCKRVIGADIGTGPLAVASKNAARKNVLDKIELRQGNGLEPIDIAELDTVIIAGMGGELIGRILEQDIEKAKRVKTLILQAMNGIEGLREFLYGNGFDIIDEELVREDRRIYNIIVARFDGVYREKSYFEICIGEMLIKNKDSLLEKYVVKHLNRFKKSLTGLEKQRNIDTDEILRLKGLIHELEALI